MLNPTMGRISQQGNETHISALLPTMTIRVVLTSDGVSSALVDTYAASVITRPATRDEVMLAMAYGDAALQMLRSYQPYEAPAVRPYISVKVPAYTKQYLSAF